MILSRCYYKTSQSLLYFFVFFQALVVEKKMEFERLRIQFESLLKTETEQQEFIDQLILQS